MIDTRATFSSFTMMTKQAMLDEMEQAFLDPTGVLRQVAGSIPSLQDLQDPVQVETFGQILEPYQQNPEVSMALSEMLSKVGSFSSLTEVDWTIDLDSFHEGNIGVALSKFKNEYLSDVHDPIFGADTTKPVNYRNYLLAIWTTIAPKVVYMADHQLTPQQAIDQLQARFHQNFATYDDTPRNANLVLIHIFRSILMAPTGKGFGFGITIDRIEDHGTRTPRAYLDYLIGLTTLSAVELGLRYRLDLTRDDS